MTQPRVACVKVTLNSYFRKCRVSLLYIGKVNDPLLLTKTRLNCDFVKSVISYQIVASDAIQRSDVVWFNDINK